MLNRILTDAQDGLLRAERTLLTDLLVELARFGAPAEDQAALDRAIRQLDEFFLLVVIGEFNAGKSAVINALLGTPVVEEGVTPTTTQVTVVRFGERPGTEVAESHVQLLSASVDLLRELHIVDTPGTNAIIREHETVTVEFVPRSDLVLFVTSIDRPFTESERAFLERTRDWGKKIVIAINKVDILASESEIEQVVAFVATHAQRLLGLTPAIFPISARLALRAKQGDSAVWAASRFEALEQYLHDTLDERGRVQLKLLNPLGVGAHLTGRNLGVIRERLTLLAEDVATLDDVERQLGVYKEDMGRDFNFRMADLEKILVDLERRGHEYFDETMRLARVFDLLNKARIQAGFEREVVGDAPQQIERKVAQLVDWLVDSDFRQWQAVRSHLAERRQMYRDRIVGGAESDVFHSDRERLLDALGRDVQRVVETYDRGREARTLAEGARAAVAASAAMEVGAVGLGTAVSIITTSVAADVTGILMAGAMAVVGFFIIPARRRRAKADMRAKLSEMRENLERSLRTQFETEIKRSLMRIREGIAPYTRFVRAEREKLESAQARFETTRVEIERLQTKAASV